MPRKVTAEEFAQHRKRMDVYGYSIVLEYLDRSEIDNLLGEVEQYYAETQGKEYRGVPARDKYDKILYNLQNKSKTFIDVLSQEFVVNICKAMLNDQYYRFLPDGAPNYILNYYNARSSGNALELHIDSQLPSPGDFTWAMQVVYVLEDMDEGNGCTVICPGSHRSGRYTDREILEKKPVHAKAGDLVLWDSRTWHGTLPNVEKRSRWALIATFTRWWVKQSMDIPRSLPEHIYQQLSPEQKVVMGFCSIPPAGESSRINTKTGYSDLLPSVRDYFK